MLSLRARLNKIRHDILQDAVTFFEQRHLFIFKLFALLRTSTSTRLVRCAPLVVVVIIRALAFLVLGAIAASRSVKFANSVRVIVARYNPILIVLCNYCLITSVQGQKMPPKRKCGPNLNSIAVNPEAARFITKLVTISPIKKDDKPSVWYNNPEYRQIFASQDS